MCAASHTLASGPRRVKIASEKNWNPVKARSKRRIMKYPPFLAMAQQALLYCSTIGVLLDSNKRLLMSVDRQCSLFHETPSSEFKEMSLSQPVRAYTHPLFSRVKCLTLFHHLTKLKWRCRGPTAETCIICKCRRNALLAVS